jgi:hypothetical protein
MSYSKCGETFTDQARTEELESAASSLLHLSDNMCDVLSDVKTEPRFETTQMRRLSSSLNRYRAECDRTLSKPTVEFIDIRKNFSWHYRKKVTRTRFLSGARWADSQHAFPLFVNRVVGNDQTVVLDLDSKSLWREVSRFWDCSP